jgi:hypothetical protein
MNISIDKTTCALRIEVERKDLGAVSRIQQMMAHPGYQDYLEVLLNCREAYLECIKAVTSSEANARMSQIKAGVFKGFDSCADVTKTLIDQAVLIQNTKEEIDETVASEF